MAAKFGSEIPSVLLSGGTDSATLAVLAKAGLPWLTKPADPELIAATLGAIFKAHMLSKNGFDAEFGTEMNAG
jgi:asparagine synthetase B (glutamine-hydrolysing)